MGSKTINYLADAVAIGAAVYTAGGSLAALGSTVAAGGASGIAAGLTVAGGALNAIGTATNNSTLQTIGTVAGVGGGVASLASSSALAGAAGANSNPTDLALANGTAGGGAANASTAANATTAPNAGAAATANSAAPMSNPASTPDMAGAAGVSSSSNAGTYTTPAADSQQYNAANNINGGTGSSMAASQPGSANSPSVVSGGSQLNPGAPGANPISDSLGAVGKWLAADPRNMQTGMGIINGVASYVAPSPMDKAKINQANAQKNELDYVKQQRAALNASINGLPAGTGTYTTKPGVTVGAGGAPGLYQPPASTAQSLTPGGLINGSM